MYSYDRTAGSYPIYYNGRYADITVTKTKWIVQEMADGSQIPGTRGFGEKLPLVSYEMKNMESLPFELAWSAFGPRGIISAGRVQADAPGPQVREAIIKGHEATIKGVIEGLQESVKEGSWEAQDKLDDFQRHIVPEVRKKLVWKQAKTARRVALRFLLAKVLPKARVKVAINTSIDLPTIWYENEAGDKFVPDLRNPYDPVPEGAKYMHSRFPRMLTETVLRLISQEDVDACPHEEILIDHGLIEGLEGRICRFCGGSQSKKIGEPWPPKWQGGGSKEAFRSEVSYTADLVMAMCGRQTKEEAERARSRGYRLPEITTFDRAVILAATSCERCLNVLCWRNGLDDGYEEGSPEWQKSNTRCALCT